MKRMKEEQTISVLRWEKQSRQLNLAWQALRTAKILAMARAMLVGSLFTAAVRAARIAEIQSVTYSLGKGAS